MRRFARLFDELDTTTATTLKVDALRRYFAEAPPADAAWAAYILSGRSLRRLVGPALLRKWLVDACGLPEWLVEETRESVGDLAEAIALLMAGTDEPDATGDEGLAAWIEGELLPLRGAAEAVQRERVTGWWRSLPYLQCFLVNKLLTGSLRVGVSELLVVRALSEHTGQPRPAITRALMGDWVPGEAFWRSLLKAEGAQADPARPYPFFLASPLEEPPASLGDARDFLAEWKWDGIRAQLVRRAGETWLWSRGAELITGHFPEIVDAAAALADGTVLDGEIVHWAGDAPGSFAGLQQRIGRRRLTAAVLQGIPVRFLAFDLLEEDGRDLRARALVERRLRLREVIARLDGARFALSEAIQASEWTALAALRAQSRERGVEGLMIKALESEYGSGRRRGAWWKWKIAPRTFDGVLMYAQPGHGRRSGLYTDYTFGAWDGDRLLPVAKAYSGLTDPEIAKLDRWIRANTVEKFGPVRSVRPELVFELAFEGIAASPRHKSGIAMRFPRILRQRHDKPPAEADTVAGLRALLGPGG